MSGIIVWVVMWNVYSGVIYVGIYYEFGSDMVKFCVDGVCWMYDYCEKKNLFYKCVGKFIVVMCDFEFFILDNFYKCVKVNGV